MNNLRNRLILTAMIAALAFPVNSADARKRQFPPFKVDSSCNKHSVYVFAEIHLNVNRTMDDAVLAVDFERNSKEYETSFGKFDNKRHGIVRNRMRLIREGTYEVRVNVICETPGPSSVCKKDSSKGPLAKADKQLGTNQGKYIISLCPAFFEASDERVQRLSPWNDLATMQGDTFLHELAHFGWENSKLSIPRTHDWDYGAEKVAETAKYEPELAISNADSYRIFMMKLAVRNRTIYR